MKSGATKAVTEPKLMPGKNQPPSKDLRGAMSRQDLDKRTTAVPRSMGKRSMRGGKR